jgi:spore maturation protein CgeB
VMSSRARVRCFYDLDAPITLSRWKSGQEVDYISPRGLRDFDIVLSYTGGRALSELRSVLGARRVAPLYGWVDPQVHKPAEPKEIYRSDLSYLGTYAEDRQQRLQELFIDAARRMPQQRFVIGGAQYPNEFPWTDNIFFVRHMEPTEHPAFFCSSRLTLNVTRQAMAEYGFCPSGRLFEAAACGVPLISDWWEGLDQFFDPWSEVIVARETEDTIRALQLSDAELKRMAQSARDRTLEEHTATKRVLEFETALNLAPSSHAAPHPHVNVRSTLSGSVE